MLSLGGVSHVALTVTDLDRSQQFYTEVLDFVPVLDVGYGRICMHPATGLMLALLRHDHALGGAFSELTTGLDHFGLSVASRDKLQAWERRLEEAGVTYTPIRDMEMGSHLNFRDPDGIALELHVPNGLMITAQQALASGAGATEIAAFVSEHLGPELVPRPGPGPAVT